LHFLYVSALLQFELNKQLYYVASIYSSYAEEERKELCNNCGHARPLIRCAPTSLLTFFHGSGTHFLIAKH
jgi:hypothetical protein